MASSNYDYGQVRTYIAQQQQHIAELQRENAELRRQLDELRHGVGVSVTIQGHAIALQPPATTGAPHYTRSYPTPPAGTRATGAATQETHFQENEWLSGPTQRVAAPVPAQRTTAPAPTGYQPAPTREPSPSQRMTPTWLRERPPAPASTQAPTPAHDAWINSNPGATRRQPQPPAQPAQPAQPAREPFWPAESYPSRGQRTMQRGVPRPHYQPDPNPYADSFMLE
ncbi:MAG: hypothetical protein OJF49_003076 [Ktedonobacterales bacterium]|jgi:hypothetical protein|nr:MAG: hypothetical protein OJF49_003076 [Ktedonobacterales bacterium]